MPCYHPLTGWYAQRVNESGKRSIVFKYQEGFKDKPLQVPCGRCLGCRLERARQWAVRCMHEASLYEHNCFLTLTYREECCPESLNKDDFVRFMKRLRKKYGFGIRFFHCGEYGDKRGRPHHHVILFNHDFRDKKPMLGKTDLFTSDELDKLWPYGYSTIGRVTFESAGYVARYSMKKVVGEGADDWYAGRVREYLTMSRRPGIGTWWIETWHRDIYPSDQMIVNGVVTKPPRFYDEFIAKRRETMIRRVKAKRRVRGRESPDNTGKRLIVREIIKEAAIRTLTREVDNGA